MGTVKARACHARPGSKESGESVVSQPHVTNHTTTTHPIGSTSGKFRILQLGYGLGTKP